MILAFVAGNIIIIRNIKKISNVIFDFAKIHENFLYKLESSSISTSNNINDNTLFSSNIEFVKLNNSDNLGLTKSVKTTENTNIYNHSIFYSNENSLSNELLVLYCKYYNISKEDLMKKNYKSKHSNNKKDKYQNEEENELFKFLRIMSFYIPKFKLNVSMDYNFYLNSALNTNYIKSITKGQHLIEKQLTQSVIFELLSTECIEDNTGLITNLNFKYITNINIDTKADNNGIKNSMFSFADHEMKNFKQKIFESKDILIEDNNIKDNVKIIWKEKNKLLEDLENNFENDDYLKKEKLREAFDSFLVNTYYKYLLKIITESSPTYERKNNAK
jgi:hypothetical protein